MATNTKVLLHVDTISQVGDVINGRPIILPANEGIELDSFIADAIQTHIGHLYGIVEVNQTKGKTGITWDVDEAAERAGEYLKRCNKATVDFYVRQQMEDRVGAGKPALPPTGHALAVIQKLGINLRKQFGLSPVGWSDPDSDTPNTSAAPDNTQVDALRKVISNQNEIITGLQTQQADLLTAQADLTLKFTQLMAALNGDHTPAPAPAG